jgi:hypothetical protein
MDEVETAAPVAYKSLVERNAKYKQKINMN